MFRALLLLLLLLMILILHHYVVVSQKVSVWTSVSTFPVVTGSCFGVIEDSTTTPASLVYLSHLACGVYRFTPTSTSAQLVAGGSGTCAFADSAVGSSARFFYPTDITSNTLNTVAYISDRDNKRVRTLDLATGAVTTLAGSGTTGSADGVGSSASFYLIYGIVYHKSAGGTLYVADYGSGRIRKVVISTKNVSTVSTGGCTYLYVTNDGLWLFASSGHAIVRVRISTGETTLLAGSTTVASYVNGVGASARFSTPAGVMLNVDESALYIGDIDNRRLRRLQLSTSQVKTVAGSGTYARVDGVGTAASFYAPYGHRAYCKPHSAPTTSRRQCGMLVADWLPSSSTNAIRFVEIIETTATASLSPTEGLASTTATTSFLFSTTGDYTVTTSQNVSVSLRSPTSSMSPLKSVSSSVAASRSNSNALTPSSTASMLRTLTVSRSLSTSVTLTRSGGTPTCSATTARTLTMSPSLSSSINSATANVSSSLRSPTSSSSRSTSATKSRSEGTMTIRTFPKLTWTESASATQWRCDDRARQLLVASLANSATWWSQVAATLNDDGVVAISLSDSFQVKKINETNSSSLQFILTSTPIERVVLMNAPRIALNISLIAPPSAPVLHWTVWAVSLLGGEEGVLLSYEYNKSFDASWQMLVVQPPPPERGGWLGPDARIMQDRVVSLNVTMACGGDPRLLVVVKIPAPRYSSEFAEKVALAAQISQIISILAGGSSTSGSALGRALATKSMVICDVDSAMDGGGVLDFSINVCGEVAAPLDLESVAQTDLLLATAAARSAVVTNIIVIVIVASVLLLSSVAWAFRQDVSLSHALRFVFCLPSSLLSVWTASLPSFASSFTLLAARVQSTSSLSSSASCVVGDVFLIIAGILCSVAPAVAIITLWSKNKSNSGSFGWVCERVVVDETSHHGEQQTSEDRHTTRTCIHHPRVIMMLRWQWRASSTSRYDDQQKNSPEENHHATATQPPPRHNNSSNKKKYTTEMRAALTVLQEFRLLWYPGAVDQAVLVAASSLAVVAGLDVTSRPQCVGCTAAVVGLLLGQCLCVAWHQPFTTLFSFLFALATIAATCVGVFAQLMFLVTSPTSVSGLWMVQASVICTLIVTGLSTLKMAMDLHEFALAVYRRVSLLFGCAFDTRRFHMQEEVELMELPAIGLVAKEEPMVPASHSSSAVALIDALLLRDDDADVRKAGDDDNDDWWASGRGLDLLFWDTKGAAKTETKREQGKNRLRDDVHSEDEGDGNVLSMFNRE